MYQERIRKNREKLKTTTDNTTKSILTKKITKDRISIEIEQLKDFEN